MLSIWIYWLMLWLFCIIIRFLLAIFQLFCRFMRINVIIYKMYVLFILRKSRILHQRGSNQQFQIFQCLEISLGKDKMHLFINKEFRLDLHIFNMLIMEQNNESIMFCGFMILSAYILLVRPIIRYLMELTLAWNLGLAYKCPP